MDTRRKKVLTILCIASVVLAWRGYALITRYAPSPAKANSVAKTTEPAPNTTELDQEDERMMEVWEKQRRIAALPWGRNPCRDQSRPAKTATGPVQTTLPIDATLPEAPGVRFSGVSRSDGHWLAAIEGKIVRVGDTAVEGYRVIKITQHSITLESAGWTFTYSMGAEAAVVRPASETK
jgi:hypothetical protein